MPNTDTAKLIDEIANDVDFDAPQRFLQRISAEGELPSAVHPELRGCRWRLLSPAELLEQANVSGQKGSGWRVVALFGKMLVDVGIARINCIPDRPVRFLDRTIAFAEHNGDYLFIRPNSSVWVFHHDGHEIEKISQTYEAFESDVGWD